MASNMWTVEPEAVGRTPPPPSNPHSPNVALVDNTTITSQRGCLHVFAFGHLVGLSFKTA